MKAERRSKRITLSISPAFELYVKELYERDDNPHARYVYKAKTLAEYLVRLLEDVTGYTDKRVTEFLQGLRVEPPTSSGMIITPEDIRFLRENRIGGGV